MDKIVAIIFVVIFGILLYFDEKESKKESKSEIAIVKDKGYVCVKAKAWSGQTCFKDDEK